MPNYWLYQETAAPPEFYALPAVAETGEEFAARDTMYAPPPPPPFHFAAFTEKYRQHLQAILLVGPDPEFQMAGIMTMFVPRIPPPHYNEDLWKMRTIHHLLFVTLDTDEIMAAMQTMPAGPHHPPPEWKAYLEIQETIPPEPTMMQENWPYVKPAAKTGQTPWGVEEDI